jgi:dTDP-glucose 4,6-dehydratase
MKRVLITGIGGAIGLHMAQHILDNTDWHIVGIDSFRHKGYFDRITWLDVHQAVERVRILTHDLCAPLTERQIELIGDIDYVINLASLSDVQGSIDDPVTFMRNNSDLMINVLEYARATKPAAFLHFSTDEVYGPAPRDDSGHPEWDTILPSNPYSASKAAQEAYAIAYWRSFGVPVIITNTMNNFGETQAPSKYPAMIQKNIALNRLVTVHAASDGQIGTRYYLHSRNAADAVLFILQNTEPHLHDAGEIDRPDRYNIVGDKQVDNLELAQIIARLMGKELRYELVDFHSEQPGHDLHYGLNGAKLAELGWKAPVSFEDSLKQTIEWQQRNPEWLK